MITFVRTVAIAPGKAAEMIGFTKKVVAHFKEKFGVDIRPSMPLGGNPNRIAYASTYANLTEFEAVRNKMMSDSEYMALVAGNAPNVIAGSVHDELWSGL